MRPRVVWDSGELCVGLSAFLFSINALFVKVLGGRVPVLEVRGEEKGRGPVGEVREDGHWHQGWEHIGLQCPHPKAKPSSVFRQVIWPSEGRCAFGRIGRRFGVELSV